MLSKTALAGSAGFVNVDRSDDPGRFVRYLEAITTPPARGHVARRVGVAPGQRVLDMGCGIGVETLALTETPAFSTT